MKSEAPRRGRRCESMRKTRATGPLWAVKTGYIVISALFCVLGVVLFIMAERCVPWIGRALGIGMVVCGAVKLGGYFSRDLFRLAFQYDLAFGILLAAVGVITLCHPGEAMTFLCVMFGIPVLADGLFKIQVAVDAKRFGIGQWWLVLLLAVLTGVIGLLLVLRPDAGRYDIVCADGTHRFRFRPEEEEAAVAEMADDTGRYLYEPSAALLKAGAFKLTAARYGLRKLHPNTHLYTADHLVDGFPGRCFEIKGVTGFGKRALRDLCRSVEERANLTVRNFPGTVADLRKRLKLREGGDAYWFATTLADGRHVLIDCRKPELHARGDETSGKEAPPHDGTTEAGTPYII